TQLRSASGVLGGCLIFIPMLIMVPIHGVFPFSYVILLISGLLIILFASFISLFTHKPVEVFSVTAAYAAVMVFFLGDT
ncbi:hypothetical protein QBC36DRAFT_142543, partial [Triangularia setosa]